MKYIKTFFLLSLLAFFFTVTAFAQKALTFVQLCDPQLGMGGYQHDVETFKQSVKQINELNPDFVLICGDLVHHASDSSFTDFLNIKNKLKVPCYIVAGNHDVGSTPDDTTLTFFRNKIGKDYYLLDNERFTLIVTNTQLWKEKVKKESGKHNRWFRKTIKSLDKNKKPLIVAGHIPLFIQQTDEKEEYFNIPPRRRKKLLNLFEKHNVIAYLSGHKHELIINNYKNIQFVSGETTSKNFDKRPLGFRLWEIDADKLTHKFIQLSMNEND